MCGTKKIKLDLSVCIIPAAEMFVTDFFKSAYRNANIYLVILFTSLHLRLSFAV